MHDTPRRFPGAGGARLVGYQIAAASGGVATLPWLLGVAGRVHAICDCPRPTTALSRLNESSMTVPKGEEKDRCPTVGPSARHRGGA